jgi:hypothetical protein
MKLLPAGTGKVVVMNVLFIPVDLNHGELEME